jgi:hypothetical protein
MTTSRVSSSVRRSACYLGRSPLGVLCSMFDAGRLLATSTTRCSTSPLVHRPRSVAELPRVGWSLPSPVGPCPLTYPPPTGHPNTRIKGQTAALCMAADGQRRIHSLGKPIDDKGIPAHRRIVQAPPPRPSGPGPKSRVRARAQGLRSPLPLAVLLCSLASPYDGAAAGRSPYDFTSQVGPHHRQVETVVEARDPNGAVVRRSSRYTIVGTDLNYWDGARWIPSRPEFSAHQDGVALTDSPTKVCLVSRICG